VTSGASSDLQQVTSMARQMVINYGMSDIGPWSLLDPSAQSGDMVMRMMARNRWGARRHRRPRRAGAGEAFGAGWDACA
jgi:cell division protease FtsH